MENNEQLKIGSRIYSLYNISAYPRHAFPIDISAKYESPLELPVDNSPSLLTFVFNSKKRFVPLCLFRFLQKFFALPTILTFYGLVIVKLMTFA